MDVCIGDTVGIRARFAGGRSVVMGGGRAPVTPYIISIFTGGDATKKTIATLAVDAFFSYLRRAGSPGESRVSSSVSVLKRQLNRHVSSTEQMPR